MNFLKEYKGYIWFLLGTILIIAMVIYVDKNKPKHDIFDEIYQETRRTYHDDNILCKIKGFDIENPWPRDKNDRLWNPNDWGKEEEVFKIGDIAHGEYKEDSLPKGYDMIFIAFHFTKAMQDFAIHFSKPLDADHNLKMYIFYSHNSHTLDKEVSVSINSSYQEVDSDMVVDYLKVYGITAADLDSYYDEIINKKVLTDWCSIYDSKFSPDDYGDVTIKNQWEDWNW